MGLHGCSTHSSKQCWFGRLATSTIASTRTTHLLLLWVERKSQVGAVKSTCKNTRAGPGSAKGQTKKLAAQWHAAHRSTQEGVAGLPSAVVVKHGPPRTADDGACMGARQGSMCSTGQHQFCMQRALLCCCNKPGCLHAAQRSCLDCAGVTPR
jgi:hypothetical protein